MCASRLVCDPTCVCCAGCVLGCVRWAVCVCERELRCVCCVPCRAVPCRAVPCRAVPCRAVPCCALKRVWICCKFSVASRVRIFSWSCAVPCCAVPCALFRLCLLNTWGMCAMLVRVVCVVCCAVCVLGCVCAVLCCALLCVISDLPSAQLRDVQLCRCERTGTAE